jgi:hypothetical protein
MSPDAAALNFLTGNPYAGQIGTLSGRTPRYADVLGWENQQRFFDQSNNIMRLNQQRLAQHTFEMMGSTSANARIRAENAVPSDYTNYLSPVGLATQLGMMTYNEKGMHRAMAQGYMAMNVYAPGPGGVAYGNDLTRKQVTDFTAALTGDFLADPGSFGGLNLQGAGQVFQQMTQRSLFNTSDISDRSNKTRMEIQKMSKAVGAMQELFGGTIPELFDKMDAIFGGTTAAMGGDQLMDRVMRLKQTSQLTGQSLSSTIMMSQQGGFYAQQAGMDAGVGMMAAEQTALQLGVNYGDGLTSVRRINQGRLRQASLQVNVAGATSRMAQTYAGAYAAWLGNQKVDYYSLNAEQRRAYSDEFRGLAAKATDIGGFAAIEGVGSVQDIRDFSMGNLALELMMDDPNVARAGIRGNINRIQESMAVSMQRAISMRLDKDVDMSVFMKNGQLKSTSDIIKALSDPKGAYKMRGGAAGGIINNIMGQYGEVMLGGMNSQEVEAYLYQFRNQDKLIEFRNARAKMDAELSGGVGGPMGVMNYLLSEDGAKSEKTVGRALAASLGLLTPEDMADKLDAGQLKVRGEAFSKKLRAAHREARARGDYVQASKLATVLNTATSPEAMANMTDAQRKKFSQHVMEMEGGMIDEPLELAWDIAATEKQIMKNDILEATGYQQKYLDAQDKKDRTETNKFAREAALKYTVKGLGNEDLQKEIMKLYTDEKGNVLSGPRSSTELMKKLKAAGIEWESDEQRDNFIERYKKNAEAMSVGDPKLKLDQVLNRLAEAIEGFVNYRKDKQE